MEFKTKAALTEWANDQRNVFARPTKGDARLLIQIIQSAVISALAGVMPARHRKPAEHGAPSSSCARTRFMDGLWSWKLEKRKTQQDIEKALLANVLPGVTIVPAMVIAIEKAHRESGTTGSKGAARLTWKR